MAQVGGLEFLGPSPLGCVSLNRCPWAREVGPGCQSWGFIGQPCRGEPWRVSLCRWSGVSPAISQPGSLVLAAAASQSSPLCLPSSWPLFPGLRLWGSGPGKGSQSPTGSKMPCGTQNHALSIFLSQYAFFQKPWANFVSHGICRGREDVLV